ncbi:MAG: hypothetical protein Fur0032_08650 [Terrimicrobiaceae bacterium]
MLRAALLVLTLFLVVPAHGSALSRLELKQLAIESKRDGIPSGWCGRAMLSLLNKAGLGDGLKSGNGQDWEKILLDAGWKPLRVSSPYKAPLGSVLVYASDRRVGKVPRGTPGGYYGHVEMVALAPTGGRLYVSDNPRPKPGGSVPDNFTGRAWIPPKTILATTAIPVEDQVDAVLADRMAMATSHFRSKSDLAKVKPSVTTSR